MSENLIKDYLMQTEFYYSASKDRMVRIDEMAGAYAANAAAKLMEDRDHWHEESGNPARLSRRTLASSDQYARQLLIRYPLYAALVARAASFSREATMEAAVRSSIGRRP